MPGLIDLHTHTTFSDGTYSPAELVALARQTGLSALAVTDHDTAAGLDQALTAGKDQGLEVIPGVEFSVKAGQPGQAHLLGLFIDHRHPAITALMARMDAGRHARNQGILDKLAELGLPLSMEEVLAQADQGTVGRPHIGLAMAARGYARDHAEAMRLYIGNNGPAYLGRDRPELPEAIEVIHQAGGLAIMAHPFSLGWKGAALKARMRAFKNQGLDGLEALYTTYDSTQRLSLTNLAQYLGLAVSGGSDFHGDIKPEVKLGFGKGDLRVNLEVLAELKKRLKS